MFTIVVQMKFKEFIMFRVVRRIEFETNNRKQVFLQRFTTKGFSIHVYLIQMCFDVKRDEGTAIIMIVKPCNNNIKLLDT